MLLLIQFWSFIAILDVEFSDGKIQSFAHQLIEVTEELVPDPEVDKLVNAVMSPDRDMLEEVVGQTEIALNRYYQRETTMDNLLLEALLDATGAELAFSNGWRYGAPVVEGEITVNDLWNMIPTNPPVSTVEMRGAEIVAMLEEN